MNKNVTIRLTESQLHKIVKESVKKIIEDESFLIDEIDITKIPIEVLKKHYFDYRLIPQSTFYGDKLYEPSVVKEAAGEELPPDEVTASIAKKYKLPQEFVIKREHFHKIYVYVITSLVGENAKLIEDDMNKMNYFLSKKGNVVNISGMKYQVLQFEPLSQAQEDVTGQQPTTKVADLRKSDVD